MFQYTPDSFKQQSLSWYFSPYPSILCVRVIIEGLDQPRRHSSEWLTRLFLERFNWGKPWMWATSPHGLKTWFESKWENGLLPHCNAMWPATVHSSCHTVPTIMDCTFIKAWVNWTLPSLCCLVRYLVIAMWTLTHSDRDTIFLSTFITMTVISAQGDSWHF